MLTLQSNEQLITQLCEHQPEAINWFLPVWDESLSGEKKITDFEVRYCNIACCNKTGLSKLESTVRSLGIEVDDALEISQRTEI